MGAIQTAANSAYADYVVSGDPNSGAFKPVKSAIRALFGLFSTSSDVDVGVAGRTIPTCDAAATITAPWRFAVPFAVDNPRACLAALGVGVAGTIAGANTWSALQALNGGATVKTSLTFQSDDPGALGPVFPLYHNSASPAAADLVGLYVFKGKNSSAVDTNYADMRCSLDNPAAGSEAAQIQFYTAIAGAYAARMTILNGVVMPGATGGDKGLGTINAKAVYDDNVLLTDYVFDRFIDGYLNEGDLADHMALAFDGQWLDPDTYAQAWLKRRALPNLPSRAQWNEAERPSIGALARKLWETVEIQAVHIFRLGQRQNALAERVARLEALLEPAP